MALTYEDIKAGNIFIGSTAVAGVALPISTGTAVTCALWNTSVNRNATLLGVAIGYTSGTIALGEFGIANQFVGTTVGTGAPMAAATAGTPKNAFLGSGASSTMTFIPGTATLTAGGTAAMWLGKSIESATAGLGIFDGYRMLDVPLVVPPGQVVFLCGSVAQTAIFTCSLMWREEIA
ncbi:MAG: hypothetical protein WC829_04500 [Hyphomicrobium sp.]|jgi:hypothetical protein